MQRRKPPVLPAGEDDVGWGARAHLADERFAVAPHIVAGRVDAQRQVEAKTRRPLAGLLRKCAQLLMRDPLRVKVIALDFLIIVARPNRAVAEWLGPLRPRDSLSLADRAEACVVLHRRVGFQKAAEGLVSRVLLRA